MFPLSDSFILPSGSDQPDTYISAGDFLIALSVFSIAIVFLIQSGIIKILKTKEKTTTQKIILGVDALIGIWALITLASAIAFLENDYTGVNILLVLLCITFPVTLNTIYEFARNIFLKKPLNYMRDFEKQLNQINDLIFEANNTTSDLCHRIDYLDTAVREKEDQQRSKKQEPKKDKPKDNLANENIQNIDMDEDDF